MVYTDSYTGTEGNPVNRRSLKRQRSIRSKETQWKSVASGGQPTQVRIQALEPRAEQIQTVGTENVESFLIESRVCTLYVCTASVKRLTRLQLCSAKASSSGEPIDNAKGIERTSDWTSGQVFRVYTYTSCLACGSQTRYAIMKRERPQYSSLTKPRKTLLTSIWTRCYVRRAAWNLCGVSKK